MNYRLAHRVRWFLICAGGISILSFAGFSALKLWPKSDPYIEPSPFEAARDFVESEWRRQTRPVGRTPHFQVEEDAHLIDAALELIKTAWIRKGVPPKDYSEIASGIREWERLRPTVSKGSRFQWEVKRNADSSVVLSVKQLMGNRVIASAAEKYPDDLPLVWDPHFPFTPHRREFLDTDLNLAHYLASSLCDFELENPVRNFEDLQKVGPETYKDLTRYNVRRRLRFDRVKDARFDGFRIHFLKDGTYVDYPLIALEEDRQQYAVKVRRSRTAP